MTTQVRRRRGTAAEHAAFVGPLGEITFDITNMRLRLHDGSTAGGVVIYNKADVDALNAGVIAAYLAADAVLQSAIDGKQPLDATLTALAGLALVADKMIYGTGADTAALLDTTAYGRALLNLANINALQDAALGTNVRILSANTTFYVRTDGNDSNTGLVNDASGAFLTIQKAIDVAQNSIALGPGGTATVITIQVQAGTWTQALTFSKMPYSRNAGLTLLGDESTPSNCIISVTSATAITVNEVNVNIKGFELRTTTSGNCITAQLKARVALSNVNFGACAGRHMSTNDGGTIVHTTNYTISGGATNHMFANGLSTININSGLTVTLTGTPNFSAAFAAGNALGFIDADGLTYSGSATGKRYASDTNSYIFTNGAGANYFPGNVAGTTSNGLYF